MLSSVSVIGLGKLGALMAACFAARGFTRRFESTEGGRHWPWGAPVVRFHSGRWML
jgi:hypothetical protein